MSLNRPRTLLVAASLAATLTSAPVMAAGEGPTARDRATAKCKAERKRLGSTRFHDKYGVHNDKAALRRCIQKRLKASKTR